MGPAARTAQLDLPKVPLMAKDFLAVEVKAGDASPIAIEVVDPTGAGNAYGGGWFVTIAATGDAREAGCHATVSAALILTAAGMPPLDADARARARQLLEIARQRATPLFG